MAFDVDVLLSIPRLSGLVVSLDGQVVVGAALPERDQTRFATALWQVDPRGAAGPKRLTAPRAGVSAVGFVPDGGLLYLDRRADPDDRDASSDDGGAALWELPALRGEPRYVTGMPAGISSVRVARDSGTVVVLSEMFPSARTADDDRAVAAARRVAGTSALFFDGYPFRQFDQPLGPRSPRLLVLDAAGSLRDLTGDVGRSLRDATFDVTPDGRTVVSSWETSLGRGERDRALVAWDVATGERRTLCHEPGVEHYEVACSPDGRHVAVVREWWIAPDTPLRVELWVVPLSGAPPRRLVAMPGSFPTGLEWTPDSRAVLFVADENGRAPLWRIDVDGPDARPVRLSRAGAFSTARVAPDGSAVYALRSTLTTPTEVVRLDPAMPDQEPVVVHAPEVTEPLPGKIEEVRATAADGTRLRAWLVRPADVDGLAPLVVQIHGGPMQSWTTWHPRRLPHVFAARGYATLYPDPAMSTGYGQAMLERGWDQWGGTPYTDVLALTDAALALGGLDPERTAVVGASYGGYLTSWIIGHTDRFRAAVSHAGVWDMRWFRGTTDHAETWDRWWGSPQERPDFYRYWSPSTYVEQITTPVLFTYGGADLRNSASQSVAAYTDLQRLGRPSALLCLPNEGHLVARPGNLRVWYETVLAWLDHHVLDEPWQRPKLL